jgi:oxygen-independent coproporphyrinogen-3 oxidase
VEAYVARLIQEIETVTQDVLPGRLPMARLHLGGGTPTLLSRDMMARLLDALDAGFRRTDDFEFSVEIDPTEAPVDLLDLLAERGLGRASVGVQDFDPAVQQAIGRPQSYDATCEAISHLRRGAVGSVNIDLLYGLPHQSEQTLRATLDQVVSLHPDRLALYGYAHVPHMSKRQVMIDDAALPGPEARYALSEIARTRLIEAGYVPIGIDHFALPSDSMTHAARTGQLARNFQGYTTEPCQTLLGFGASAISKFPQGYVQNAVSTSAYHQRVEQMGCAGHKGTVMSDEDQFIARLISDLMCTGRIRFSAVLDDFPAHSTALFALVQSAQAKFPDAFVATSDTLRLGAGMMPLARLVSAHFDQQMHQDHLHSLAV